MNKRYCLIILLLVLVSSCSKSDDENVLPLLSEYEISVIDYFTEVALGFEFGNASSITRKWNSNLNIYIGGSPTTDLLDELENIKTQINELATDGFEVNIVTDSLQSNYYIFFGTGSQYAAMHSSQSNLVESNLGLFSVFWNGQNQFTYGRMYVDIVRASPTAQKHLLREELTQSLGLARDSPRYIESIFQSTWTTTTEYAQIDRALIRLLYHPNIKSGLDELQAEEALTRILLNE